MSRGFRLLFAIWALVVFLVLLRTCASLEGEQGGLSAEESARRVEGLARTAPDSSATSGGARLPAVAVETAPASPSVSERERLSNPPDDPIEPALPRVALRAVDEGGQPLRDVDLRLALVLVPWERDPFDDRAAEREVTSDSEGRLEVGAVETIAEGKRRYVVLRSGALFDAAQPARAPRSGAVEIPARLDPHGLNELGDCVLALEPLLLAGSVHDEEGRPLARALLDVSIPGRGAARNLQRVLMPPRPVVDAEGRFELRSREAPAELCVSVTALGCLSASKDGLEPGARDVELVLAPSHGGRIEGRALVDDGVPVMAIELLSRHRDGGRPRSAHLSDAAGHFALEDVVPGTVDLEFVLHAGGDLLHALPGVVVPPDAASGDRRLAEVDLRGRVDLLHLRLLDAGGRPLADHEVGLEDRLGRGGVHRTDAQGRLVAPVPSGSLAWTILAPGFLEASVVLTRDERVLRLSPD